MKKNTGKWTALCMAAVLAAGLSGCGDAGAETQNAAQPDAAQTEATENDAQQEQTDEASKADSAGVSGEKVSVVLATNWGEGDAKYDYFYPLFEQFQEEHKDTLDITLQTYSTEDYKTKIKTQTASGDLPDVFTYWGGGMMKDMVDAGLLLNVDDYFAVSSWFTTSCAPSAARCLILHARRLRLSALSALLCCCIIATFILVCF